MSDPINPRKALLELIELAPEFAEAKAQRIYLEEFRKSKKALLMQEAAVQGIKTSAGQEVEAYAHPDYLALLAGLRCAVEKEESLKWRMTACQAAVEVWRSQEASNRAVDRGAA